MPREFIAHTAKLPRRASGVARKVAHGVERTAAVFPPAAGPPAAEARSPEIGGPQGPEPTRYGDWERKGICVDF